MEHEPLYTFTSQVGGKSTKITIFPDRIEWAQPRAVSGGKVTAGILTGGLSLLATGVKGGKAGSEMIPVRSIHAVTTKREGFSGTVVQVAALGGVIDFKVSNKDAPTVKDVLTQLVLGTHPAQSTAHTSEQPSHAIHVPTDIPAQLQHLANLHAAGVLSDAEFGAKKAELLSRM